MIKKLFPMKRFRYTARFIFLAGSLALVSVIFQASLNSNKLAVMPWFFYHLSIGFSGAGIVYIYSLIRFKGLGHPFSLWRWLAVGSFLIVYWLLASVWDIWIVAVYRAVKRFTLVDLIFALSFVVVAFLAWLMASASCFWRWQVVNEYLGERIRNYLKRDPKGTWYGEVRAKGYKWHGYESVDRRYELELLDLIRPCASDVEKELTRLEIERLNDVDGPLATAKLPVSEATKLALYRSVLAEHYYPQYRRECEAQKNTPVAHYLGTQCLVAIEQLETIWLTTKRIQRLSPGKNKDLNDTLNVTSQKLQNLYNHLTNIVQDDRYKTVFPFSFQRLYPQYRLKSLRAESPWMLTEQLYDLQGEFHSQIEEISNRHEQDVLVLRPANSVGNSLRLWRSGVLAWLEELTTGGDDQAIIQSFHFIIHASVKRQQELQKIMVKQRTFKRIIDKGKSKNKNKKKDKEEYIIDAGLFADGLSEAIQTVFAQEADFQREVYRYGGYAWWRHAHKLGRNEFGEFAWQKGLENLRMAQDTQALEALRPPFPV